MSTLTSILALSRRARVALAEMEVMGLTPKMF
jgi:hypothetical protein